MLFLSRLNKHHICLIHICFCFFFSFLVSPFLVSSLPLSPPTPSSLSSVLTYIFMMDVALPGTRPTASPHVAEFVGRVLRRLKPLTSEAEIHNHVHEENTQETDERTQAVKLLKTGQSRARVGGGGGGGGATKRKTVPEGKALRQLLISAAH